MIDHTHLQSYQFEEQQFAAWLDNAKGVSFMAQEQQQLTFLMPRAFGHYSVYLGLNAKLSSGLASPIKNAMALTSDP